MAIMVRQKVKKNNEMNACNALITILERVVGRKYECESFPDEENSKDKEPDFILKSMCSGMGRMAVEHAVVPSFNEQVSYVMASYNRAEEINKLCMGKIPGDRFYFISPPHTLINSLTNLKKQRAFDECLAQWVIQKSPHLQIDESVQYSYEGYVITLTCGGTHPQRNGSVGRIPASPTDGGGLQKEAFDKAVQHGLDKLIRYKCNPSERFETVLLLEDVAGLQHERITEGIALSERDRIDKSIDYIIVLMSFECQMILGNVWKENQTWHRFIPANRRFNLRKKL